jgi:hypothetical protein
VTWCHRASGLSLTLPLNNPSALLLAEVNSRADLLCRISAELAGDECWIKLKVHATPEGGCLSGRGGGAPERPIRRRRSQGLFAIVRIGSSFLRTKTLRNNA